MFKVNVFRNVTPCIMAEIYRLFRGTYYMMLLYLLGCGNLCLGIILSVFKGSLLSSLYTGTFRIEATGTSKTAEKLYQCVRRHFS